MFTNLVYDIIIMVTSLNEMSKCVLFSRIDRVTQSVKMEELWKSTLTRNAISFLIILYCCNKNEE